MPYRQADDGPSSDATIEAWGTDLAEMLVSAWSAALEVMVEDADELSPVEEVPISLSAADAEELLFELLDELIFNKDARGLLLALDPPEVERGTEGLRLRTSARGERIDGLRHRLGTDIKAVTYHQFTVTRTPEGWFARVVLDT